MVLAFGLSELSFHKPGEADRDTVEAGRDAFHVIEVPDNIPEERHVEATQLVSDRAAAASDMTPQDDANPADPYSEGATDIREFDMPGADIASARKGVEIEESEPPEARDEAGAMDLAGAVPPDGITEYVADEGEARQSASSGRSSRFKRVKSRSG